MSLEKPATVAADPVKSTKWDEFTACRAESSPRVRGAGHGIELLGQLVGIIPAHAGSSRLEGFLHLFRWDHPRACGEQEQPVISSAAELGSSPRVRGAVDVQANAPVVPGIIPACAGSS